MKKSLKALSAIAVLSFSVFIHSGCVPLVVGAAAGAGGYIWLKGALEKEFAATAERTRTGVVRAFKELKLSILEDSGDRLQGRVVGEFSDGEKVAVYIDALTERTSKVQVRVGLLGDKPKSEIILAAIERNI